MAQIKNIISEAINSIVKNKPISDSTTKKIIYNLKKDTDYTKQLGAKITKYLNEKLNKKAHIYEDDTEAIITDILYDPKLMNRCFEPMTQKSLVSGEKLSGQELPEDITEIIPEIRKTLISKKINLVTSIVHKVKEQIDEETKKHKDILLSEEQHSYLIKKYIIAEITDTLIEMVSALTLYFINNSTNI